MSESHRKSDFPNFIHNKHTKNTCNICRSGMPKVDLTKAFVSSVDLPDGCGKLEFFDKSIRGWYLEVRGLVRKTYYIKYRDSNKKIKCLRLGKAHLHDYEEIRAKALEISKKISLGDFSFERVQIRISLEDFVVKYFLPYIKNQKKSWQTDWSYLRNHILPEFGPLPLIEIKKISLIQFHIKKRNAGLAPATADHLIMIIRHIFNVAIKWEVIQEITNPVRSFDFFNENNKRQKFIQADEIESLLNSLSQSRNPLLLPIIKVLILTGLRKSELLNARWTDLDYQNKIWTIPFSKSGKPRYVPLTDPVLEILDSIDKKFDLIFANPKTGKKYESIFYSWNQARKRAGLSDFRIHDLRHSYASFLVNSGRSLYEVQKLLGHSSIAMTQRYAHLDNRTLFEASSVVKNMIRNI